MRRINRVNNIKNIKKVKYEFNLFKPTSDNIPECSICLEPIKKKGVTLKCNVSHTFHKKCILKWLKTNNTCPLCRTHLYIVNQAYNNNQPYTSYSSDSDNSYNDY
jgi:hypothetical protein